MASTRALSPTTRLFWCDPANDDLGEAEQTIAKVDKISKVNLRSGKGYEIEDETPAFNFFDGGIQQIVIKLHDPAAIKQIANDELEKIEKQLIEETEKLGGHKKRCSDKLIEKSGGSDLRKDKKGLLIDALAELYTEKAIREKETWVEADIEIEEDAAEVPVEPKRKKQNTSVISPPLMPSEAAPHNEADISRLLTKSEHLRIFNQLIESTNNPRVIFKDLNNKSAERLDFIQFQTIEFLFFLFDVEASQNENADLVKMTSYGTLMIPEIKKLLQKTLSSPPPLPPAPIDPKEHFNRYILLNLCHCNQKSSYFQVWLPKHQANRIQGDSNIQLIEFLFIKTQQKLNLRENAPLDQIEFLIAQLNSELDKFSKKLYSF